MDEAVDLFAPAGAASVLCLGNISIDESVHLDGNRTLAAGGDAVYSALGAMLVSGDVRMLAPVGNDLPAETLRELTDVGLAVDGLPRRNLPTLRHLITHRVDGGRDWSSNASDDDFDVLSVQPADLDHDDPDQTDLSVDAVLLTAMSLRSQVRLGPWLRTHTRATVYLDLREDYLDEREALLGLIATSDVFLPSEIEATTLADTGDLSAAAAYFRDLGPATVVVKCGASGCLVATAGGVVEVPASPAYVVDTTGAGDAFCGAFAAAHARSGDAVAAARVAAGVAAVAVSGLGTAPLLARLATRRRAMA